MAGYARPALATAPRGASSRTHVGFPFWLALLFAEVPPVQESPVQLNRALYGLRPRRLTKKAYTEPPYWLEHADELHWRAEFAMLPARATAYVGFRICRSSP